MTANTPRSRKNKGRILQNAVADRLREAYQLTVDDLKPAIMGEQGVDIKLSKAGKQRIPFDVEVKNTEKASVWQWIEQAESNSTKDRIPLTIFKRNRSNIYCIISFDDLIKLDLGG